MLKLRLFIVVLLVHLATGLTASAQSADPQSRATEWKNYKLPAAEFSRFGDAGKTLSFRAPAAWALGGYLHFKGPHEAELQVILNKVPDGIALKSLTNAVLQNLRNIPGGADSLTARPTEISGVEAREFFFTYPDLRGETTRRMIWCTVSGPNAVSFVFICPEAKAAELEPYFKAVIESVVIFESDAERDLFERLRGAAIKEDKPVKIDHVRALVETITGFSDADRAKAVEALVTVFDANPSAAVELLMDRDPIVRASAIEAVGRSSNRGLDGFLVRALADQSAMVAVRAAQSLAKRDDIIKLLREDSAGWQGLQVARVMRVAPFLNEQARNQLVDELLRSNVDGGVPSRRRITPPPPPPPAKTTSRDGQPTKEGVLPGQPPGGNPKLKSLAVMNVTGSSRSISDRQRTVLELLPDLDSIATLLPASKLLEWEDSAERALSIALDSRSRFPVEPLLNLLSSKDRGLTRLVALNLANSATSKDIARIEEAAKKPAAAAAEKIEGKSARSLAEELRITIKKIRWRERLEAAEAASREALFKEAFVDEELSEWAWPYVMDYVEAPGRKNPKPLRGKNFSAGIDAKPAFVSRFAENLLPANPMLYAAIPDAGGFVAKLGGSLSSIQLDSSRSQASLLLVFKAFENLFGKVFGVRNGASILQSSGVKPQTTAVFARWTAGAAPKGLKSAQRKAVIFRVQDRDRFEQLVATYHQFGRFEMLPEYVSGGARFLSALPAVLPLSASMVGARPMPDQSEASVLFSHTLIGYETCEGFPVTVFERRERLFNDAIHRDMIYMAYVEDAAILAWDWFSLRDCLARMKGQSETLAGSASFKQAVAGGGDVIYLSEPLVMMSSTARKTPGPQLLERGALRISKAGWESTFDLSFGVIGWQKHFTFKPAALKAPNALLPRSSVAYLLMSFDFATGWRLFASSVLGTETTKEFAAVWALDFEREVLPELGPECGAVLLGVPSLLKDGKLEVPWALYIQTKSDKLEKALAEGKLFKDATTGANSGRIRIGSSNYWLSAKKGFLILANSEAALAKFDSPEHLAGSREFEKTLKSAPAEVIALGGVSIDAATAAVPTPKHSTAAAEGVDIFLSLARAFHSLNLHAAASENGLSARLSVSLDREARYSVSDLAAVAKDFQFAAAEIEARGVPIVDQRRLDSLAIRLTSQAPSALQRIRQDVSSAMQSVEERPEGSLTLRVKPRRPAITSKLELPVSVPALAEFLKPAGEKEDPTVVAQAKEIAGPDKDAWSVARKLADWTFKNLKWKRVDGASAGSTLATREADCLEFSELFVAMARAVGLPARIVSGLAYSGSSFGGHAWVEVWVGDWIELDPTWGTNFVDATHIRSKELLAYAALNVINIEVLELRREVADFQKDPTALAEALCEELNGQRTEALSVAIDPGVIADVLMGEGTWAGMNTAERDQMYSSHHRLIVQIHDFFETSYGAGARLLRLKRSDAAAEGLIMSSDGSLMRIFLIRRDGVWVVREMTYEDLDYSIIAETLNPAVLLINAKRKGERPPRMLDSAQSRVMQARARDLKLAVQIADLTLGENPGNKALRYLKGLSLLEAADESDAAQIEEAIKIIASLAAEQTNYAPAIRELGAHYASADEDDSELTKKQEMSIALLKRYASLVPEDPRPHKTLASIYDVRADQASAETAYRTALQLDPLDPDNYASLASFLVKQKRYKEALVVVDQTRGRGISKEEKFADLFLTILLEGGDLELADGLAAESPARVFNSFRANVNLAVIRMNHDRAREALPLLKRASELDPKNVRPHTMAAEAHRKLRNWALALKSADAAIAIEPKEAEAHYQRACALAQLRRPAEAFAALKYAFDLDDELYLAEEVEQEPDLKPLLTVRAFKKLVADIKRAQEGEVPPQKPEPDKQQR